VGARAIENQRSNWFSTAFFVSFLAEQKRKERKNYFSPFPPLLMFFTNNNTVNLT